MALRLIVMACGPGKLGDWLVPDSMLGLKLDEACAAHDRCYAEAGGPDRLHCDWKFLETMLTLVRHYAVRRRRWMFWVAVLYYAAVRLLGGRAFKRARARAARETTNV